MVWSGKHFLTHTVSTGESPFRLLYGRDPQLPTELMLDPPVQRETVSLDDYQTVMCQQSLRKAQRKQKVYHDRRAKEASFRVGGRVFIHTSRL